MVADTLRSPITPSESALGPAAGDRETMEPVCHHTKLYTCLYSHSQIISLQPPPPPPQQLSDPGLYGLNKNITNNYCVL